MTDAAQTPIESNDYEKFRKPIKDIIELVNSIDVRYREKCFEILLNHHLSNGVVTAKTYSPIEASKKNTEIQDLSTEAKLFLDQYNISDEMVHKLFVKEKNEVHTLYEITETKKAKAQIQLALLTAFENALFNSNGTFEFSLNKVRQKCHDIKMYDGTDFFSNFQNAAGLFGSLNHEVVKLSENGKEELAKIVVALNK